MTAQPSQHKLILPLEGYRALAILAVLIFHLDKTFLPGGYLGVDLFFVISGFIITKGIIKAREAGTFKLSTFYAKRFRRLFPALLATTLVTLIFAYFILSPDRYSDTGKSALFSLFSLANINFWMEAGYFDAASITKPILHMWSLSVEEQFYLFWPFVLVLFSPRSWKIWAIALLILSFTATFFFAQNSPQTAFFWFPFRIYEFMGGAILSILGLGIKNRLLSTISLLTGTVLFVGACLVFDESSNIALTGGVTLLACMLLLMSMENQISEFLFGNPVFVWIGQRSYSIYLVHWPLIVLYVYNFSHLSGIEKIGLGGLSLIIGGALKWAIEDPFRHSNSLRSLSDSKAYPPLIGTGLASIFFASLIWGHDGFPKRLDSRLNELLVIDNRNAEFIRNGSCFLSDGDGAKDLARDCYNVEAGKLNMLLIGSSFAADLNHGFQSAFSDWKVSQITMRACVPSISRKASDSCRKIKNYIYDTAIKTKDYDLVVISGIGLATAEEEFGEIEEYMNEIDQDFVLIGPRPTFFENPRDIISRHGTFDGLEEVMKINMRLRKESNIPIGKNHYYSSIDAMCGLERNCKWQEGGKLLYQDRAHFSPTGSIYFGKRFAAWLETRQ